jgi:hypothetical protein
MTPRMPAVELRGLFPRATDNTQAGRPRPCLTGPSCTPARDDSRRSRRPPLPARVGPAKLTEFGRMIYRFPRSDTRCRGG